MGLPKEALLDDLALIARSSEEVSENNRVINNGHRAIDEYVYKTFKRQINYVLIGAIIFALFILPKVIFGFTLPFLVLVVSIVVCTYCKKALDKSSSLFHKSSIYKSRQSKLKESRFVQDNEKMISDAAQKNNQISQSLAESGVFSRIPEQYANYRAAAKMFTYIYNLRADTLKEAINLFELEEHQERMEAKQDHIINKTEEAAMHARAAAIEASLAANY